MMKYSNTAPGPGSFAISDSALGPAMKLSFGIDPLAYQIIGDEERSLTAAARKALHTAAPAGAVLKVTCSRVVAEEIRDWFGRVATGQVYVAGLHWKCEICRKAERVLNTTLLVAAGLRRAPTKYVSEIR